MSTGITSSRKRIGTYAPNVSGGGGGTSTPVIGWGPDFGESSDNNTFTANTAIALTQIDLIGNINITDTLALTNLDLQYNTFNITDHLSGTALGAPFWQSEAHAALSAAAGSIVVNKPTGTVDGDLLLMFVGASNVLATPPTIDIPSGWTLVRADTVTGAVDTHRVKCFFRYASSEPTSYTITFSVNNALNATAEIHRIIGIDPSSATVINTHAGSTGVLGIGNPTNPPAPTVTTTVVNCMVFAYLYHDHLAIHNTHTPPANHIEVTDYESTIAAGITSSDNNTAVFAATGATGAITIVCTETVNTDWITQRIAIAPGIVTLAT